MRSRQLALSAVPRFPQQWPSLPRCRAPHAHGDALSSPANAVPVLVADVAARSGEYGMAEFGRRERRRLDQKQTPNAALDFSKRNHGYKFLVCAVFGDRGANGPRNPLGPGGCGCPYRVRNVARHSELSEQSATGRSPVTPRIRSVATSRAVAPDDLRGGSLFFSVASPSPKTAPDELYFQGFLSTAQISSSVSVGHPGQTGTFRDIVPKTLSGTDWDNPLEGGVLSRCPVPGVPSQTSSRISAPSVCPAPQKQP